MGKVEPFVTGGTGEIAVERVAGLVFFSYWLKFEFGSREMILFCVRDGFFTHGRLD